MNSRLKYRTKQREMIIEYFENNPDIHITANDICAYFKNQGADIGQSTVYRQLEKLVDEGELNKYFIDSVSPACFEYVGKKGHVDSGECFHCKCEKCGKLIHLHCDELEEIEGHLFEKHNFRLNPMRTVFYGVCDKCI